MALSIREAVEIDTAMINLGYARVSVSQLSYEHVSHRRWNVKLRDKVIGIYDLDKHTFVD